MSWAPAAGPDELRCSLVYVPSSSPPSADRPSQSRDGRAAVFRGPRPVVIGHRGSGQGVVGGHRENSLQSVLAAVAAGADWVEVDVHRCGDGVVVVHDPSAADGGLVIDRNAADLAVLGIDRLDAVFAALPPHVGVDVDLKSSLEDAHAPAEATTAALLAPLLDTERHRRPLLVTSFDVAALLELRDRVPSVPLGLLTWISFPLRIAVAMAARLPVDVLALQTGSLLTRGNPPRLRWDAAAAVRVARSAGLQVLAWCPDAPTALLLAGIGVDGLVVDDTRGVAAALKDVGPRARPPG